MAHQARKRFGQNFLQDRGVIHQIIHAIAPREGENLIEIGPGHGAITLELLKVVPHLQAVELDRDLIAPLEQAAAPLGQLTLYNRDALSFDFRPLATPDHRLRVIGNLPYNISTPILFHLLGQHQAIQDMHFMLQKEVVERMAAPPGSKRYGRLSVMLQVRCSVTPLFTIDAGAFRPRPAVDSAFVRLTPLADPPRIPHFPAFEQVVAKAFSQRRKTLRNSLRDVVQPEAFSRVGIDSGSRAETLSVEQFVALSQWTVSHTTDTD